MAAAADAFPVAIDFGAWIDSVRPQLAPPVGNKLLFGGQQKVMIVGGPNQREDYHMEVGEEIFYQIEGDMVLKIVERGVPRDVVIKEGEIFMLPGHIPHSPQRKAGTVGLVLERDRLPTEIDGLRWYTHDGSSRILYQEFFHCTDLGVQLKPVIERFFASESYKTDVPAAEYEAQATPLALDSETAVHPPIPFKQWIERVAKPAASGHAVLFGAGCAEAALSKFEYQADVVTAPQPAWEAEWRPVGPGELFLYQLEGCGRVQLRRAADGAESETALKAAHVLLVPGGGQYLIKVFWEPGCACLVVTNSAVAPAAAAGAADAGLAK